MTEPDGVCVVGAGIVGLATARELMRRHPGLPVTVLDKERAVGTHQSGHNSGVVHAGLYYPPGSLKATLCRRGRGLLREYATEHGIAYAEVGKLVVALTAAELPGLDRIGERALLNEVPGLRRLDAVGLREVEPAATGVAALHSPRTAAVDYPAMCRALAADIAAGGGTVRLDSPVDGVRAGAGGALVRLATGEVLRFAGVVVCAGLGGDRLARGLPAADRLRIVPFRGEYWRLRPGARDLVRGMIYPVPDPRYPFLGVHLTRRTDGEVLVGPNAVLALAREGYRWRDIGPRDLAELAAFSGTWRMASRNWRTGARELSVSLSKRAFAAAARRYVPELGRSDLVRAPAGVRAQAVDRRGNLLDDFAIDVEGPVVAVRNAPSPAATSSLAIAEHIAELVPLSPSSAAR